STSVIGASSAMAGLMPIASATSGVASIGKPKPSAPWANPDSRQTAPTKASSVTPSSALTPAQTAVRTPRTLRRRNKLLPQAPCPAPAQVVEKLPFVEILAQRAPLTFKRLQG